MTLTVDDLSHHLNRDTPPAEGTQDRTEMQQALDTAVEEVTRMTGMPGDTPVTVTVSAGRGDRSLLLPYVRLVAVGSVADSTGYAVAPTSVDLLAGIVDLGMPSTGGTYMVTVTGRPWPSALRTAALDWATHVYDTQRTVTSDRADDEQPPSFALPNRVAELLTPRVLPGIA